MLDPNPEHGGSTFDGTQTDGIAFGATKLEQLLLAIIRAHPSADGRTDAQRLSTAMKSLVGQRASPNPLPGDRDDRALLFMGRERHCDEANRDLYYITRKLKPSKAASEPPKVRSDKALAELAADHYFNFPNDEARYAVVNRLREKFSGSYMRKQGKGQNVDFVATYKYRAVEHDYIQESLEAEALARVCQELQEWGVPTKR